MAPDGLNRTKAPKTGWPSGFREENPMVASMGEVEGVAVKVALKPVLRAAGKAELCSPDPAMAFTHSAGTVAPAEPGPAWITAVTETLEDCPEVESAPVTEMVEVVAGVAFEVVMVKVEVPDPFTEGGLKLATTFEFEAVALSETVPLKPFTACTVTVKLPVLPAVITRELGVTDRVNSELPLVSGPELLTRRRGETEQPVEARIVARTVEATATAIGTHLKQNRKGRSSLSGHLSGLSPQPGSGHLVGLPFAARCLLAQREKVILQLYC